jgi:hypothetical protein
MKYVPIVLALTLCVAGCGRDTAPPSAGSAVAGDLRIAIVPASRNSFGTPLYMNAPFALVLHNQTGAPISVWEEWCSWGWYSVSLDLTSPTGQKFKLTRGMRAWTMNGPSPFIIPPNQFYVWGVDLCDGTWEGVPTALFAPHSEWKMKARFHIDRSSEAKSMSVWTGTIESEVLEFKAYKANKALDTYFQRAADGSSSRLSSIEYRCEVYEGDCNCADGVVEVSHPPEPASLGLLGLISTGIYFKRRFFIA